MKQRDWTTRGGILLFLALFGLVRPFAASDTKNPPSSAAAAAKSDPAAQAKIVQSYGMLPLAFEANHGQTDSRVKFLTRGAGYSLFLTGDEAVLALRRVSRESKKGRAARAAQAPGKGIRATGHGPRTTDSILRMALVGANPDASVTGTDELPGKSNYFIGNDPKKWRTNVPNYAKVHYHDVYPGVDLVYYSNQGHLEYDFVVAPGADPTAIKLNVGAVREPPRAHRDAPLRIDRSGDLVVKISGGEARFHKPVVYQPAVSSASSLVTEPALNVPKGHSSLVDGHYRLAGHHLTFSLGSYDRTKPLVIDPALSYSTYLGGSNDDVGQSIAVDASGNAYVTGVTLSLDFPIGPGAFQTTYAGQDDAFVTKLNSVGSALVYSTYLGGSSLDWGFGISVDASGDAYVGGFTVSADFPITPGAFQTACNNCNAQQEIGDAFVVKLNPSGAALVYSTYLGGSDNDQANGIAVDSSGAAYLTGRTFSTDFPTTPGAFQVMCGGGCGGGTYDAFVTKLNSSGSALVYSSYLGGSGPDYGQSVAVDPLGDAYVTGLTESFDFPVTPGAFQTSCGDVGGTCSNGDAFVTKLNPAGAAALYSTFVGGSSSDQGNGIALDTSENAYLTGFTYSTDFPITPGAFQSTCGGCSGNNGDVFVTELNSSGSALQYSTYLGGSGLEWGFGIAVDALGSAYATGFTQSSNFPTTPGAFQTSCGGGCASADAFVAKLNPTGSALIYSTYLGGSGTDYAFGIALDPSDNPYVTGYTFSSDFPTTPGAFQTTCGGGGCTQTNDDVFLTKFAFAPAAGLSPSSLDFGDQPLGTTSTSQTTTLTNTGTTTLSITSIGITGVNAGDFAQTNTCGTSVAPGASCTISVTFTPTATGTRIAAVTITDNAANSPQTVSLTGVGTQGAVTFSPTSLTFPTQVIFTTSKAQNVTLTNSGNGTLTITGISASGNFSQTNTCGTSVAPGASCTISVKFAPKSKGTLTGTLSVTDNAPGSPQTVSLKGTGTYVQLVPASLNFGTQPVGTKSLPRKITLTNKGSVAVSISKISITGTNSSDFTETNTCGGSVAGGASCFITVTFTPSAKGKRSASVSVSDNGGGSPQTVALSGTGT